MAKKEITAKRKKSVVGKFFSFIGLFLLFAFFCVLLVNSLLGIFKEDYYTSFNGNRFFAIVTDSMEGENGIPTGSLIVSKIPQSKDEIQVGSVITYKVKQGKAWYLITHRVTNIKEEGEITFFTTKGDNAPSEDGIRPIFSDIVGVYSGQKIDKLGYAVGFSQSREGAIALIIILFIIASTYIMMKYMAKVNVLRESAIVALKNVKEELSLVGSNQADIIKTIINVHDAKDKKVYKKSCERLEKYVAENVKDYDEDDDYYDSEGSAQPRTDNRSKSKGYGSGNNYKGGYGSSGSDYGSGYGSPSGGYGGASGGYGSPSAGGYGDYGSAPSGSNYGGASGGYGNYGDNYGTSGGYGSDPSGYGAYGAPSNNYGTSGGYGSAPDGYGGASSGYGNYGSTPSGYGDNGYGGAPSGYGAYGTDPYPSPDYSSNPYDDEDKHNADFYKDLNEKY